jgi:hypothetical protein
MAEILGFPSGAAIHPDREEKRRRLAQKAADSFVAASNRLLSEGMELDIVFQGALLLLAGILRQTTPEKALPLVAARVAEAFPGIVISMLPSEKTEDDSEDADKPREE